MTRAYHKYKDTHREVDGQRQKYCTKCCTWKDESEFTIDRSSKDGLDMRCKECARLHGRERYKKARKNEKVTLYLRFNDRHRVVRGVKQKLCTKCGKWKKLTEYYKSTSEKDGRMCSCRKCNYNPARKPK